MNKDEIIEVKEGKTTILLMKDAERIYDASVFYNPKMSVNRDFALLHLYSIAKQKSKSLVVLDPFAGSGIRSFRILNELPSNFIKQVIISDISEKAVTNARMNAELVFKDPRVEIHKEDAFNIIAKQIVNGKGIDVIDIDPFGTPIAFIDIAVRALMRKKGFLFLTATDHQILCSKENLTCLREYNAYSTRNYLCHEIALRILLYNILISAGRVGAGIEPLISFQFEHFFRVHVKITKGKQRANEQHKEIGFVYICPSCNFFETEKFSEVKKVRNCPLCNKEIEKVGPLWLGKLGNEVEIENLMKNADFIEFCKENGKIIHSILAKTKEEINLPPMFYNLPLLYKKYKKNGVSPLKIIEKIEKRGYSAKRTIFDQQSIKTDAPYFVVHNIIKNL